MFTVQTSYFCWAIFGILCCDTAVKANGRYTSSNFLFWPLLTFCLSQGGCGTKQGWAYSGWSFIASIIRNCRRHQGYDNLFIETYCIIVLVCNVFIYILLCTLFERKEFLEYQSFILQVLLFLCFCIFSKWKILF